MLIAPGEIIIKAKDEASGVFSSMGSKVVAVGRKTLIFIKKEQHGH